MRLALTPRAETDVYELEKALHLPGDTRARWIKGLKPLERFPWMGRALETNSRATECGAPRGPGCSPSMRFCPTKSSSR